MIQSTVVLVWCAVLATVSGQHVECDTKPELRQNMDYVEEVCAQANETFRDEWMS